MKYMVHQTSVRKPFMPCMTYATSLSGIPRSHKAFTLATTESYAVVLIEVSHQKLSWGTSQRHTIKYRRWYIPLVFRSYHRTQRQYIFSPRRTAFLYLQEPLVAGTDLGASTCSIMPRSLVAKPMSSASAIGSSCHI